MDLLVKYFFWNSGRKLLLVVSPLDIGSVLFWCYMEANGHCLCFADIMHNTSSFLSTFICFCQHSSLHGTGESPSRQILTLSTLLMS